MKPETSQEIPTIIDGDIPFSILFIAEKIFDRSQKKESPNTEISESPESTTQKQQEDNIYPKVLGEF